MGKSRLNTGQTNRSRPHSSLELPAGARGDGHLPKGESQVLTLPSPRKPRSATPLPPTNTKMSIDHAASVAERKRTPGPLPPRSASVPADRMMESEKKVMLLAPLDLTKAERKRFKGDGISPELQQIQQLLHKEEAKPFQVLQHHVFHAQEDEGAVTRQLEEGILAATGHRPTSGCIEEMKTMMSVPDSNVFSYGTLASSLWSDDLVEHPTKAPPRKDTHHKKHLFLSNSTSGFYNDNVEPKPSVFGLKKGSSSVRYDLFTNQNAGKLYSTVPKAIMDEVDRQLKIVASEHPKTKRPMDPLLSYLTISQGKRCIIDSATTATKELPIDIIKVKPRKLQQNVEWSSLPRFSLSFSKLHLGQLKGAERRNCCF